MKKIKFLLVGALSALALTSCSLFNDNDIVIENNFKTKEEASQELPPEATAGGVGSQSVTIGTTEALLFKNVVYSNLVEDGVKKIKNSYKSGFEYTINEGNDYVVDPSNNNFDLYVPKGLDKTSNQKIVLFIHGGAWVSGVKSHVNPYVKEFVKRGYIAATMEYTLLKESMDDASLSIFRNLDEIDATVTTIKSCLVELGFDGTKLSLVIGGASSGAHLSMLYAYSRTCPMTIDFVIDAVGPTDIKSAVWKKFKEVPADIELDKTSIATEELASNLEELPVSGRDYGWNEYQTMKIANGMCGLPYSLETVEAASSDKIHITNLTNEAYLSMTKAGGGEDLLSVTHYISVSTKKPIICAYAGMDNVVGIKQFANLQSKLDSVGAEYELFTFKTSGHVDLDRTEEQTTYNAFIDKIVDWLANK